ncbi:SDR family oxidoreductase [Streptomyces sp. NPDC060187]|uniref:SDR family oxidoreductase n=1 Tax=Streptomyces sp. NPDC060187 TaxID=3347067 RepID=UPI0036512154
MEETQMRVVVAGATGRIGSRTVGRLRDHGVEVVSVSRSQGVDVITGEGLSEALRGVDVVVDVTDARSRAEFTSAQHFGTATGNLLEFAAAAGAEHYVVLSVVGADRAQAGYFRAKLLQEELARRSPIPHSVVRATPFFESVEALSVSNVHADGVHVSPARARPASLDDVAATVAHIAVGVPLFGLLEFGGPEEFRLNELVSTLVASRGEHRAVIADPYAPFFGAVLEERTLLPGAEARLGRGTIAQWLEHR